MTPTLEDLRAGLVARIKASREAAALARQATQCEHVFQRFRQTVPADNLLFRGRAHFIVNGCPKCRRKEYVDYVVER